MQEIKEVSLESIPVIQQLSKEIWNKVYPSIISQEQIDYMLNLIYDEKSLHHQITEQKHHFIIINLSKIPVGFASYSVKSTDQPTVIRLNKLYLQPEHHGKALGKAMLENIVIKARILGGQSLELNVNKYNPAISFYERQGFKINAEEVIDIGKGYVMDDYIMTLSI